MLENRSRKEAKEINFEKILDKETANKQYIFTVINKLADYLHDRQKIILKVNKKELDYLQQNREKIYTIITNIEDLEIISNPQVKIGGCLIETQSSFIDARLESQIDVIFNKLTESLE